MDARCARGVQDVPGDVVKPFCRAAEEGAQLLSSGVVQFRIVGSSQVGHHADEFQCWTLQERFHKFVFVGSQSQTMHAGVQFEVHSPAFNFVGFGPFFRQLHMHRRHQLRFQIVGVHRPKGGRVGVEHKDSRTNAGLAQHHAFVGIRHGEPVDVLGFQQPAKQHGIGAIAEALDHRDDALCSGVSLERTQVVDQGAGVEGQGGDVSRGREGLHGRLQAVGRGHLDQHVGAAQCVGCGHEFIHVSKHTNRDRCI